jgi:hypothetical protein
VCGGIPGAAFNTTVAAGCLVDECDSDAEQRYDDEASHSVPTRIMLSKSHFAGDGQAAAASL